MALGKIWRAGLPALLLRWGRRLRFPYLFLLTAVFFVADLIVPDVIPMVDEIIIGLVTLLLANLKKPPQSPAEPAPDEKRAA